VAAELGMSESRFSRFFRRATGNTFTDFVNRVRVNRACHLLMETDRLVTHICYEVGFNNVANFNRRFLEIKGMTPSEFRKQADTRFGGHPDLPAPGKRVFFYIRRAKAPDLKNRVHLVSGTRPRHVRAQGAAARRRPSHRGRGPRAAHGRAAATAVVGAGDRGSGGRRWKR
jgi:AraC-like DNA-binding protein